MYKGIQMKVNRDRVHTEVYDKSPWDSRSSNQRFNDENTDTSNIIEIRRRSRQSDSNDFQCREDYANDVPQTHQEDFVKRSLNLNPKCRSHSQQNVLKLAQSQQINFRKAQENIPVNSSLTFGSIKQGLLKGSLTINQEFMEDKKMKNEIIDQIIRSKSTKSQEFLRKSQKIESFLTCANKDGKRAKYQIVSEDEDLYYCSKCAIMLLQQGFKVEEISHQKKSDFSRKRKQFDTLLNKLNDFEGRIKYHLNSLEKTNTRSFSDVRNRVEETYDIILFIVQQMKARDLQNLADAQEKLNSDKKRQSSRLFEKLSRLNTIRNDMEAMISESLTEMTDQEIMSMLHEYNVKIQSFERYEPLKLEIKEETLQQKLQRLINEVNEHYTARKSQFSFQTESSPGNQDEKKPFRNLFCEDEHYSSKKKGFTIPQYDSYNYSPNFKKVY